jgi:hypothetical protein
MSVAVAEAGAVTTAACPVSGFELEYRLADGGRRREPLLACAAERFDGVPQMVVAVAGTRVRLADAAGKVTVAAVTTLLAEGRLELDGGGAGEATGQEVGLEGLPPSAVERARWWEGHLAEIVYGCRWTRRRAAGPGRTVTRSSTA